MINHSTKHGNGLIIRGRIHCIHSQGSLQAVYMTIISTLKECIIVSQTAHADEVDYIFLIKIDQVNPINLDNFKMYNISLQLLQ